MEDQPQEEWSIEEELQEDQAIDEVLDSEDIDDEDFEDEEFEDEDLDDEDINEVKKPALVINIQSWAIPIVGLVMLIIGLAAGYSSKALIALINPDATPTAVVTEVSSAETVGGEMATLPTSAPQPPSAAELEELMAFLVTQTTHFRGEADAPVTIIEFSDFQ
jgi:hypothetical protein